jgi:uncharacterized protein YjbI with pentapeptide repeats
MGRKKLSYLIHLLLFFTLFCFLHVFIYAQEKSFRDPKDVQVENITLFDFLKLHKQGLLASLPSSDFEIDSTSMSVQIDYFLKQKGYGSDFLSEANLSNADLSKADLRFLSFKEANLTGCSFEKSDMSFTNLKEANLTDALLMKANLTRSNIKEATVKNADFTGAILHGADIHEAEGLTAAQLLSTKSLLNTKLPSTLKEEVKKTNPKLFKLP